MSASAVALGEAYIQFFESEAGSVVRAGRADQGLVEEFQVGREALVKPLVCN